MRLVTFAIANTTPRLGALTASGDLVIDLARAHAALVGSGTEPDSAAATLDRGDMALFLAAGTPAIAAARAAIGAAERAIGASPLRPAGAVIAYPLDGVRLLPVVHRPGKVVCVGLNFQSHVDEARAKGLKMPDKVTAPLAFSKLPSALVGHGQPIVFPVHGTQLDYEVELAMVIGKRCRHMRAADVRDYVAGLTISVDLSLRDILFRSGDVFEAKNFDTFCPLGPSLVTLDELGDLDDRVLRLWVNGELRQEESMRNAFFGCGEILAYWSERFTFEAGDIITAGTPGGVGIFSRDPPRFLLKPGDVVKASIDGLGDLVNTVVRENQVVSAG